MCKLKSGLLFKNGVFVPDYDSHDKMLKEKALKILRRTELLGSLCGLN